MHDCAPCHRSVHRAVSVAVLLTLALFNVSPAGTAVRAQRRGAPEGTDGETLFRAVFFLQGSLSDEIPELRQFKSTPALRQLSPQQDEAVRAFQSRLIRELDKARPQFFSNFEKAVKSGDRARIARALENASEASKHVIRRGDPAVARFLDRHETALVRAMRSVTRDGQASGPPDLRAIQRAIPKAVAQDAERLELAWLKGVTAGGRSTTQQIGRENGIFIISFVIVHNGLPIVSPAAGGGLYHERLVNSLAVRFGGD